jgi:actin-related protein
MLSCLQDPTAVFANQSFSIPDEWKGYPAYKEITHNKYASNALRNLIYCFESPPECGCVKDCGLECCNRALYM